MLNHDALQLCKGRLQSLNPREYLLTWERIFSAGKYLQHVGDGKRQASVYSTYHSRSSGGLNGLTHVKHLEQYLGLEVFVGVVKVAREPSLVFRMD